MLHTVELKNGIYMNSHGMWLDMIFIQSVVCFYISEHWRGEKNTQLVE